MNTIQHKTLRREDWPRILDRTQAYLPVRCGDFSAMACLMQLKKVRSPLVTPVFGEPMTILDDDYLWLQIAPENSQWWLSVMFDETGKLLQYYFDITRQNDICGEDSTFDDLFLDIVFHADGRMVLLDTDELEEALRLGNVTAAEYNLAWNTANSLMAEIPPRLAELERFCCRLMQKILPLLP